MKTLKLTGVALGLFTLLLAFAGAVPPAQAQSVTPKLSDAYMGISLLSSDVDANGIDIYDNETGMAFTIGYEPQPFEAPFLLGGEISFTSYGNETFSGPGYSAELDLYSWDLTFKPKYYLTDRSYLGPIIGVSYFHTDETDEKASVVDSLSNYHYVSESDSDIALRFGLELGYAFTKRLQIKAGIERTQNVSLLGREMDVDDLYVGVNCYF
ncbi:outer membrane beta-barrel protein [Vibrio coralliilyticus]|uniref:outer membrane beta-barrel protein n=1 Tax=Vibrio coralliilyticus TaxID=190893 RepID=UPI0018330EED|nr:outer membrane beta-barrel protein [Vibrio coralliilyticus]NUW66945.1 porin family protein [Vibrio coralliilyticus]